MLMKKLIVYFVFVFSAFLYTTKVISADSKFDEIVGKSSLNKGFFNTYWNGKEGKIYLEISQWKREFLYLSFLAAGVGSNDLGLDRGKFKASRVVHFERFGPKVLLVQSNYRFRAVSENQDEQRSVSEAFAQSVLAGFQVLGEQDGKVIIDISDFIIRDEHDLIGTIRNAGQGNFSLDIERSALYRESTKNYPFNTEFEAILTFEGNSIGSFVRAVVPSPKAITIRQRHSFVALPEEGYKKRAFDPRAGYIGIEYMDYATPLGQSMTKRFIRRHRLIKKYPNRMVSEPVEPIIYYIDRGVPEPIRSALIEGASWWNEAFEAAGFKNAFQVNVLPEDADPLDVRYNVVQWVHRSTRGWSYGFPICDPRTGEIIKGHVSLGSLRVRQDYLIAQGLLAPFEEGKNAEPELKKMALARLRQLAAHEIGHTLGLAHNYIASTFDRGSVMDYPHPLIKLDANGNIDLSAAYDSGIGVWDKVAIRYGYSQFTRKQEEELELTNILLQGIEKGITFLSDQDARPIGSAHPSAHLWDNGNDAAEELEHILKVRRKALSNFSEYNIPVGKPMAQLEEVLVPIYFLHRYQTEAAVKVFGGIQYNYSIRGDNTYTTKLIDPELQVKALKAVLKTIRPDQLALDESIIKLIPPKPMGYNRGRENVKTRTGITFDPLATAETAGHMTLKLLFNDQKCARLIELHARDEAQPSFEFLLNHSFEFLLSYVPKSNLEMEIQFLVLDKFIDEVIRLAQNPETHISVRAITRSFLGLKLRAIDKDARGNYLIDKIANFFKQPEPIKPSKYLQPPDGSPIGFAPDLYNFLDIQCPNFH